MELEERQRWGALALAVLVIVIYIIRSSSAGDRVFPGTSHRHADPEWGPTVVELAGDTEQRGIYYMPRKAAVKDLLSAAMLRGAEEGSENLDRPLKTGMTVRIQGEKAGSREIRVSSMGNALRFALDLPIGLNTATAEDLMMVQGIGETTADEIIQARMELGRFRAVDDLLKVKGIGPRKLEQFNRSFYIDSGR